MYGNMHPVKDRPTPIPAKNALTMRPREILGKCKVTLGWLIWQVAREEVTPQEAAWAMCPDVEVMSSGFVKLMGHTELVFRNWLSFYRESGGDQHQERMVREEVMKIWGLKRDRACHLLPKK